MTVGATGVLAGRAALRGRAVGGFLFFFYTAASACFHVCIYHAMCCSISTR